MARPPSRPHAHPHDHAHGAHAHGFDHAERHALDLDDPSRDAWQCPKDIVDAMAIQPGMTVADVGAGTGYFEPWLSRAVGPSGAVLALDAEPAMVRYLNERVAREHLANVRPALVTFDDPKLPEGGVDRILVVHAWHHMANREAYAAKLRSGLKVGGIAFVVDYEPNAKHGPPPPHRVAAEQIARELAAGGLTAELSATTLPEQYIVVGKRS